jgi:hypothetical protein
MTVVNWDTRGKNAESQSQIYEVHCKAIPASPGIIGTLSKPKYLNQLIIPTETEPMLQAEKLEKLVEERTLELAKKERRVKDK